MRWIQLDSDMPNDPRIQRVLTRFGNAGLGMLVRLWCFVAAHGKRKPGVSLDTRGKPIPREDLVTASGASDADFDALTRELACNGHIACVRWEKNSVLAFPAMSRRADTYAKRRVRTLFEHSSNNVPLHTKPNQTKQIRTPLPPLKGGRLTRADFKHAQEVRRRVYGTCPHKPRCSHYDACVRAIALERKAKVQA